MPPMLSSPGCQLGAADPRYVTLPYQWLLSKKADTGLLLRCCGVPAAWSGDEEMHQRELADIRSDWEALGKPILILACPSCGQTIRGADARDRNNIPL